jgi:hypothetical protein
MVFGKCEFLGAAVKVFISAGDNSWWKNVDDGSRINVDAIRLDDIVHRK